MISFVCNHLLKQGNTVPLGIEDLGFLRVSSDRGLDTTRGLFEGTMSWGLSIVNQQGWRIQGKVLEWLTGWLFR